MNELIDIFLQLTLQEKKQYIKEKISHLSREKKINVYKNILKTDLTPETTIMILPELKKLNYKKNIFYEKFLFHPDDLVRSKIRRILNNQLEYELSKIDSFIKILNEGDREDREFLVNNVLNQEGKIDNKIILAVLKYDDQMLRRLLIKKINNKHIIDQDKLVDAVKRGVVWYTRAGIVELLGKLKSDKLFKVIDLLINDQNVEVKLKLISVLGNYERDKAKKYLHILREDNLIWVAKEAKKALSAL